MSVYIGGHADRSMAELAGYILEGFPVVQEQTCECMASVVQSTTPDLGPVAGFPENAISEVVHINVTAALAADRLPFFPNDLTGTKEDQFWDFVLPFR